MDGDIGCSTNNGGSSKTCDFCTLKGHKDTRYFKKFHKKALAWYKEKNAKTESALSSMEVLLTSLDQTKLRVDITLLQAGSDDMFAILCQENM